MNPDSEFNLKFVLNIFYSRMNRSQNSLLMMMSYRGKL